MENLPGLSNALEFTSQRLLAEDGIRVVLAHQSRDEDPESPNSDLISQIERKLHELESRGLIIEAKPDLRNRWTAAPNRPKGSRSAQWRLSRMALLNALRQVDLEANKKISASISHCPGLAVAGVAISNANQESAAIGIDCEPQSRNLPDAVLRRITNPDDRATDLPPLAMWCLKEAVFKTGCAGSSVFRQMVIQINIAESNSWFGSCNLQDRKLLSAVAIADGFIVALAVSSPAR